MNNVLGIGRRDVDDVILAGDVGGTNARFMLYTADESMDLVAGMRPTGDLIFKREYANEGVSSLTVQLKRFLSDANRVDTPPIVACIAIAGPVIENQCEMSNRGWKVDGFELGLQLGIKEVRLVNDFVAAGFGLLTLDLSSEVKVLQEGQRCLGAPIACIGSGTGLGETYLTAPHGTQLYEAYPTEGGHVAVSPLSPLEVEMIAWMKDHFNTNRISVERIVSGIGLATIYEFLAQKFPDRVDQALHRRIWSAGDMKGKVIAEGSKTKGSICEQVLQIWATHYGLEAGATCLKYFPLGGLFLAGGMTPKLMDWIAGENSNFMAGFRDQGRVSYLLKSIPIYAVLQEDIGQRGAHYVVFTMYQQEKRKVKLHLDQVIQNNNFWRNSAVFISAIATTTCGIILFRALRR